MNAAAPSMPRTGFKFMLTVREGPDSGASFQLLPPKSTIGRGADCDVVLSDPRASRSSAMIEFSMERITITDISNRQSLTVNGELVHATSLKSSDMIRIGDTVLEFFVEAVAVGFPKVPINAAVAPSGASPSGGAPQLSFAHPRGTQMPPGGHGHAYAPVRDSGLSQRQKFYIGVGVIGFGFAMLLLMNPKQKGKEKPIRTIEEIEQEIKSSQQSQDDMMKKREFKNEEEKTRFEEANRHFAEGFRDYQKGQWVRAMRSFETAKTIDPKHPLAGRYYALAEKERDELIATLTLEGRRYREKSMYSRCSAQFEKVLEMIPNKDDVKFKEAESLKKECDLQLEGRYRY